MTLTRGIELHQYLDDWLIWAPSKFMPANRVSNLGQWEKVALYPSSDFIAKNQPAREGSQSVSPVIIPALTTIMDTQFKEDRTLFLVWTLRYYLDQFKDLRGSRSLLFISFKKRHTSNIRPATLSSWLNKLSYYVINKQISSPWTWSKLKLMTVGSLRPLRPSMLRAKFPTQRRWFRSISLQGTPSVLKASG